MAKGIAARLKEPASRARVGSSWDVRASSGVYAVALHHAWSTEHEAGSNVMAVLFGNELGFFPDAEMHDEYKAEIARFFARCVDCREPVAVPYGIVSEMATWGPRWGNWKHMIVDRWLESGRWDKRPEIADQVSPRQRAALVRLHEILLEQEGSGKVRD